MTIARRTSFIAGCAAALLAAAQPAFAQAPELGGGWMPEFTLTARQLVQLAEATPEDTFGWRPAPGVRSISEVYMHLALGTSRLLQYAELPPAFAAASLPKDPEKSVVKKADVIQYLKRSLDAAQKAYATADKQKTVKLFGRDVTVDGVLLRILLHCNEHMGQSIAYARMNGVVPPWSQVP
jgi:uncharacterized damage-inducible protein DinB